MVGVFQKCLEVKIGLSSDVNEETLMAEVLAVEVAHRNPLKLNREHNNRLLGCVSMKVFCFSQEMGHAD